MVVKPPVARRGCVVDGRCCAQRAVHLGRMCRKSGVWVEVDDVLSVGSRCWGRAVGPRQCGRLRQCGRPGWRRGCEGWLPASSCPVPVFGLVVWGGGITTIGVRHAGDTPSRGFYGSKTPRCAAGLCGGWSVLCSTCSPPRPHAPKKWCLGRSGLRSGHGFAMLGVCHRASSAWSASSVWSAWSASSVRGVVGSSRAVAAFVLVVWGELRP